MPKTCRSITSMHIAFIIQSTWRITREIGRRGDRFLQLYVQEARVMEQALISAYTLKNLDNNRREIATGKLGSFSGNMSYFVKLPGSYSESELLCYMER